MYSQENTPLLLQTDFPESLYSISSTDYDSPSLPILGSVAAINTSTESESEDVEGNIYPMPEPEHDSIRTLKRSLEESECTFQDSRSSRQPCSVQYLEQYPKKRSAEAAIPMLFPNDSISPSQHTLRSRHTIQPYTLHRKPKLRFEGNISIGAERERCDSGQELAGVHSHILQKTAEL